MANGEHAGMNDARRQGRIAGSLYLVVVLTGMFSLGYVPSRLAALTDAHGLPDAIRMSEPLFRAGVASFAVEQVAFLLLPMALYPLLRPAGRFLAAAMVAFVLVAVPIALVALAARVEALTLATDPALAGNLSADALRAAVERAMGTWRQGLVFAHLFWGAWLVPFGLLILRSRALPAVLGALLVAGGVGYFIDVFGTLLHAGYSATAFSGYVLLPAAAGEIGTCLWLLLFGVRNPIIPAPGREPVPVPCVRMPSASPSWPCPRCHSPVPMRRPAATSPLPPPASCSSAATTWPTTTATCTTRAPTTCWRRSGSRRSPKSRAWSSVTAPPRSWSKWTRRRRRSSTRSSPLPARATARSAATRSSSSVTGSPATSACPAWSA